MADLWNFEHSVTDLNIGVPAWIDQDIDCPTVAAIVQGGCASGAYMPAVTYHTAQQTMLVHGDDILQYIEDTFGELPDVSGESWSGMACKYVSAAVELWASGAESEIEDIIDGLELWCAGWNMCGYMPEMEPSTFADFDDARDFIVGELEERAEQADECGSKRTAAEFTEFADLAGGQSEEFSVTVEGSAYWVQKRDIADALKD